VATPDKREEVLQSPSWTGW